MQQIAQSETQPASAGELRVQFDNSVKTVQYLTLLGYQLRGWDDATEPYRQAVVKVKGVEGSVVSNDTVTNSALAVLPLESTGTTHFDYDRGIACARTLPTLRTLDVSVTDRAGAPLHVDGLWFRVHYHC